MRYPAVALDLKNLQTAMLMMQSLKRERGAPGSERLPDMPEALRMKAQEYL